MAGQGTEPDRSGAAVDVARCRANVAAGNLSRCRLVYRDPRGTGHSLAFLQVFQLEDHTMDRRAPAGQRVDVARGLLAERRAEVPPERVHVVPVEFGH
jgi:hypothetical protein